MPAPVAPHPFPLVPRTPHARWEERIRRLPPLEGVLGDAGRCVVVAPHPDDETLGVGGLVGAMGAAGREVRVVAVTDGEASHPDQPGLACRRRREQQRALRLLGWRVAVDRLGLADGQVADEVDALVAALRDRVDGASLLVAPWRGDGHPDHDAAGRAAAAVAEEAGIRLLSYPVWLWQWADEEALAGLALRRLDLPPSLRRAKAQAVACFRSQTEDGGDGPVLTDAVRARAAWPWEVVVDEPAP
ncbi:PIG-L family deacetylase [Iamia majanohamensis]|uniref:PIG-L family deacetylase n=1 Tax=Iamia majanohamensis TaxID=467976 RepID=A0AAE9Y6V1_9ACTN|nr:PIG-L family deacetylase [Iamia majanohamensis]WCO67789.1 PIG-L family deacetylase [Iamia majanohamensis]